MFSIRTQKYSGLKISVIYILSCWILAWSITDIKDLGEQCMLDLPGHMAIFSACSSKPGVAAIKAPSARKLHGSGVVCDGHAHCHVTYTGDEHLSYKPKSVQLLNPLPVITVNHIKEPGYQAMVPWAQRTWIAETRPAY